MPASVRPPQVGTDRWAARARWLTAALALGTLLGCASRTSAPATSRYAAPQNTELGRLLSYDAADRTAVVELVPQFQPRSDLAGRTLIARDLTTLEPKAKLTAAPYQHGRFLGAYVQEGTPAPGDEIVLAPAF